MKIEIEKYIPELSNLFTQEPVEVVYLFGSQAMGTAGPISDIDIGILLNSNIAKENYFNYRLSFTSKLVSIFQKDKVDVVILNECPPLLKDRVIRYGKVIYCRDEIQRIRFEVKTLDEYLDFLPMQERYFEQLFKDIEECRFLDRPRINRC